MKVGEYIRLPLGIGKITKIYTGYNKQEDSGFCIDSYKDKIYCGSSEMKKLKSSPNIIDLVQEGDYINGKLVTTAEDVYTTDNIYIGKEVFVNHDELIIEEDIENIVTHEMFESMKYEVGE